MPKVKTWLFKRREDRKKKFSINLDEDKDVIRAVRKYVTGPRSEADVAIVRRRRKAWKGRASDGDTLIPNIVRDIRIRLKERSRRMARPAALRQIGICYPDLARRRTRVPTVQLVPNRRHASSGYPYPDWLAQYGVTREDWSAFVSRIRHSNRIDLKQSILLSAIALTCEVLFFVHAWPLRLLAPVGATVIPMYLTFKRRQLRHAVTNGIVPVWTATWNKTYFGPKGLCVGFDLPGPVFKNTFVHPKRKAFPWMRVLKGPLKKPMAPEQAARRARITIARVRDPTPNEGRVPRIDPTRVPRVQHRELVTIRG